LKVTPARAILRTPEREEEIVLEMERKGDTVIVNVPADIFSGYAFIALEE